MTAIVAADDVSAGSTYVFSVQGVGDDEEREAILVRTEDGIAGWLNYCQHVTHVSLDKGSGGTMRDGEILCRNHGGTFEAATGRCTFGPCEGAYLEALSVAGEDGRVHLVDDAYEYAGDGPIPENPAALSSTSHLEF